MDDRNTPHKLIPASRAREEYLGGVSDMTIWRWLETPSLNFPKPIRIGRRRYWRESDLINWVESRATDQMAAE